MHSDGSGYKAIILPVGGHREPIQAHHLIAQRAENGDLSRATDLILDGTEVLNFSTQRIPPAIRDVCAYADVTLDQIDYFVLHQANKMINDTIRKKLQQAPEKFPSTLYEFGNTSSASIPLTMTTRLEQPLRAGPATLVLSGFGIGLSWGSCVLRTDALTVLPLLEL